MADEVPQGETEAGRDSARARTRYWLTIGLAGILAGVVAALILLLSRANDDYDHSLARQSHSLEAISLAKSVEASLARGEASLARFAVGLDKQDGRIYQREWGLARQYLNLLHRNVRDNPTQLANVNALAEAISIRGKLLGDTALSANYRQGLAAISKYHAAGRDPELETINDLLAKIVSNERTLLSQRNQIAASDRDSLNQAILLFSLLGAGAAIIAIAASVSLIRAQTERQSALREQFVESARAGQLEEAVATRTAELAAANAALRSEMAERADTENQLRQAQKMEAVGQLTGGIAHDFNNMLAVVVGGLELAARWLYEAPDKARRHLDNALDGANRAADLTRRLLAFARSEPARPEMMRIDDMIAAFAELIARTIGDRIALELDLGAPGRCSWVDRQQFENALLNLSVNARDAMDGHGTLAIRTGVRNEHGAEKIAVEVIDTGCGMAPEVLQRVFDPFYTTKPTGQGTGLGMSQVFAFSQQSGGDTHIDSTEGKGTRVCILLPVAEAVGTETTAAETKILAAERAAPGSGLSILVVEDDQRVLTATVDAVTELGHQTWACPDPQQAEQLVEAHGPFDLILSDVLMPGLTGPDMVEQLKKRWPDVAVLFVTGFAGDASELSSFGDHDVLRKPFTLAALDQAIRRSCDSRAPEVVAD